MSLAIENPPESRPAPTVPGQRHPAERCRDPARTSAPACESRRHRRARPGRLLGSRLLLCRLDRPDRVRRAARHRRRGRRHRHHARRQPRGVQCVAADEPRGRVQRRRARRELVGVAVQAQHVAPCSHQRRRSRQRHRAGAVRSTGPPTAMAPVAPVPARVHVGPVRLPHREVVLRVRRRRPAERRLRCRPIRPPAPTPRNRGHRRRQAGAPRVGGLHPPSVPPLVGGRPLLSGRVVAGGLHPRDGVPVGPLHRRGRVPRWSRWRAARVIRDAPTAHDRRHRVSGAAARRVRPLDHGRPRPPDRAPPRTPCAAHPVSGHGEPAPRRSVPNGPFRITCTGPLWTALRAHGRWLELLGRDPSQVMVEGHRQDAHLLFAGHGDTHAIAEGSEAGSRIVSRCATKSSREPPSRHRWPR